MHAALTERSVQEPWPLLLLICRSHLVHPGMPSCACRCPATSPWPLHASSANAPEPLEGSPAQQPPSTSSPLSGFLNTINSGQQAVETPSVMEALAREQELLEWQLAQFQESPTDGELYSQSDQARPVLRELSVSCQGVELPAHWLACLEHGIVNVRHGCVSL